VVPHLCSGIGYDHPIGNTGSKLSNNAPFKAPLKHMKVGGEKKVNAIQSTEDDTSNITVSPYFHQRLSNWVSIFKLK